MTLNLIVEICTKSQFCLLIITKGNAKIKRSNENQNIKLHSDSAKESENYWTLIECLQATDVIFTGVLVIPMYPVSLETDDTVKGLKLLSHNSDIKDSVTENRWDIVYSAIQSSSS